MPICLWKSTPRFLPFLIPINSKQQNYQVVMISDCLLASVIKTSRSHKENVCVWVKVLHGLLSRMNVLHQSGYVYRWVYQRIVHEITVYFILCKHLTNNYETRSVWFSHEEILSRNSSIHIKCVYRPETCAHGQCEFLEKLMMGNFTARLLKSRCALFFREVWKARLFTGAEKNCKRGKWPWASSVPWLPRKLMGSWDALGGVWPAGRGRFFFPSTLP